MTLPDLEFSSCLLRESIGTMEAMRTWIDSDSAITITLPPALRHRRLEVVVLAAEEKIPSALMAWEDWVAKGPKARSQAGMPSRNETW